MSRPALRGASPSPLSSGSQRGSTGAEFDPGWLRWELEVARAPERFKVVCGGRRIHKTDFGIKMLIVRLMARPPGSEGWYLMKQLTQARMVMWRRLKAYLSAPWDWMRIGEPNERDMTVMLRGNRLIGVKGCENAEALLGGGPAVTVWDEVSTNTYASMTWSEVVRPMLTDKMGEAIFLSTPRGKEFFYRLFCNGVEGQRGWASFRYWTQACGTVPMEELELERKDKDPDLYAQEYECRFLGYVGLAVHEFIHRLCPEGNLLRQDVWMGMRKDSVVMAAMDWARSSGTTAVVWYGVGTGGRMVMFHELLMPGGAPGRVVGKIRQEEERIGAHPAYYVVGRDAWAKESNGLSVADQLSGHGLMVAQCPSRLEDSVARLNDLAMTRDEGDGLPLLLVVDGTCPMLRHQLATIASDQIGKELQHKRDLVDALRMAAMMNARGPQAKAEGGWRWEPQRIDIKELMRDDKRRGILGRPNIREVMA